MSCRLCTDSRRCQSRRHPQGTQQTRFALHPRQEIEGVTAAGSTAGDTPPENSDRRRDASKTHSTVECLPCRPIRDQQGHREPESATQNMYFNPSCISRLLTAVDPIRPKSAAPSEREGAEN